jgi:nitrite reductase/ring-hydroxylating ferredoxin subunit
VARYVVGTLDQIPPGDRLIVDVAGRSICIFNIAGELHGLRNRCPHQGGPLCRGRLVGAVTSSAPGEYSYDGNRPLIRCPWHAWEFDVRTGQSWIDPGHVRVRTYEVEVQDALAADDRHAVPVTRECRVPHAEVVPVTADAGFVIVEV